jgi:hypothetical protein
MEVLVLVQSDWYPRPEALELRALALKFFGAWADLSETHLSERAQVEKRRISA